MTQNTKPHTETIKRIPASGFEIEFRDNRSDQAPSGEGVSSPPTQNRNGREKLTKYERNFMVHLIDEAIKYSSSGNKKTIFSASNYKSEVPSARQLDDDFILEQAKSIIYKYYYNIDNIEKSTNNDVIYASIDKEYFRDDDNTEKLITLDAENRFSALASFLGVPEREIPAFAKAASILLADSMSPSPSYAHNFVQHIEANASPSWVRRISKEQQASTDNSLHEKSATVFEEAVLSPPEKPPALWSDHRDNMSVNDFLRTYWKPWLRPDGLGVSVTDIKSVDEELGELLTSKNVRALLDDEIRVPLAKEKNSNIIDMLLNGHLTPPKDRATGIALQAAANRRGIRDLFGSPFYKNER